MKIIESEDNKALLITAKDEVAVEWITHYDGKDNILQLRSTIVSTSRYSIKPGHRKAYQAS